MKNQTYNLKVILLAAGKSERFNGIKLLAKVQEHENSVTLVEHALQQISVALKTLNLNYKKIRVATGSYHSQITTFFDDGERNHSAEHAPEHSQFVFDYCEDAHLGLGYTISQSVGQLLNNTHDDKKSISHILIALADQVALTTDDYIALIKQSLALPNKLVCAKSEKELMPPAIFPSAYFTDLMHLKGDKGAKSVLYANKVNLQTASIPHAERDIDTQQDLANWYSNT
jgi:molybdenum cofactor cytidylyltransferase